MATDDPTGPREPVTLPRQRGTGLDELPLLIPVPRAAELLGISRSAAYRCAASGDLPTTHLGGRVYVVTSRLQSLLELA
jgi:hypothetical protein